jgi:hypothetical protein
MEWCQKIEDGVQCVLQAEFFPVLLMRVTKDGEPTRIEYPDLVLCRPHGAQIEVDDLVTDPGWVTIVSNLAGQGHAEPDRELNVVALEVVL